ncbi:ABC transporter permease [Dongia sp.]|uniref:ABC transporter permease n=1 Tax=Dongia sp. TaxID=1977262 RepID=UPI003752C5E6
MIRVRLERRTETPVWMQIALPIGAVVLALLICSLLVAMAGAPVLEAYSFLFLSTFQTLYDVQDTLVKASPLIWTGLAVAVAFRAKFWNIGAEGQLIAGAMAAAFIGQREFLPEWTLIPAMLLGAMAAGALWALIPALLKVRLKVDDVVTTLLANSIMLYGLMALLEGPWKDPVSNYPNSPVIREAAQFPILAGDTLHMGVAVSIIAVIIVWWLMERTTTGFAIKVVGANPQAAAYAGFSVGGVMLTAAAISGALAGLAGAGEVGGIRYQVVSDVSSGYGYAGIVIATLADLKPLGVIPAALFFAIIMNGADAMSRETGVPVYLADVIQGVALLTMVAGRLFTLYRLRITRPGSTVEVAHG